MQTRVDVFEDIFMIFLVLGTIVGVIVVAYTLYNAYKYRDTGEPADEDAPTLGELPTGGQGGKKLFLSFALSAVVVISLVAYAYVLLLYVETGPEGENPGEDAIEIDVEGWAFDWDFHYEDGVETTGTMYVPAGETVWINVTSDDVWHSFGISDQRVKADAIPGEYDQTWFVAEEPGEYEDAIECFELCGSGHSYMDAEVIVMHEEDYEDWMDEQEAELEDDDDAADDDDDNDADDDTDDDESNDGNDGDDEESES